MWYFLINKSFSIGLGRCPINTDELEILGVKLEEIIRLKLRKKLRRRVEDLFITINLVTEEHGRKLSVRIDVYVSGKQIAPLTYDEVVAEAISEATKWLADYLRNRCREKNE